MLQCSLSFNKISNSGDIKATLLVTTPPITFYAEEIYPTFRDSPRQKDHIRVKLINQIAATIKQQILESLK